MSAELQYIIKWKARGKWERSVSMCKFEYEAENVDNLFKLRP